MSNRVAYFLVCLLVLTGHLSIAPAYGAELDGKARAEGKVVLYSCPGRENVEPVVKEFERRDKPDVLEDRGAEVFANAANFL